MKAAILVKPGQLEIRKIPVPACPAGGVLVKIMACGICSADLKMISKGHRTLVYPRILGHEIAGIVAKSRSALFKEGDRVQVAPGLRCGRCIQCRRKSDNQCEQRQILGFNKDGGFADYLSIPIEGPLAGRLNLLPDKLSFSNAVLAEPLACCINAQDKIALQQEDTVLIIGAGPLGLLHTALACLQNVKNVWVAEIDAYRRTVAHSLGADRVFDPAEENLFQALKDATASKRVDVIIFATSEVGLDEKFIKLLSPGGRVSFFSGTLPLYSKLQLDSNLIHYHELVLTGAYGCTADQNRRAVDLIASKNIPVQELISQRVVLDNIMQGLESTKSKKGLKSIVEVQNE